MLARDLDAIMYRAISTVPGTTGRESKPVTVVIAKFRF